MADSKISQLTNYPTPLDADLVAVVDTANTTTKKTTWANVKATLKTYFDTLYALVGAVTASGLTMSTNKVLGRTTAATGAIEELSTTGTGNVVLSTSPTLVTPALGTPSSGTLTNATGLPIAGLVASTSTAIGVGSIELGHATDTTISRSSAGVVTIEAVRVATCNTTTETSNATPTVAIAGVKHTHTITALAVAAAFAAPTSTVTLTDDNTLTIRIKDNATARALSWNVIFRAVGVTLPTTTVINKTLYVGFKYNVADTKWDCIATAQEA